MKIYRWHLTVMFTVQGAPTNYKYIYNNIRIVQRTKTHSKNPRPEPEAYITLHTYYIKGLGKIAHT